MQQDRRWVRDYRMDGSDGKVYQIRYFKHYLIDPTGGPDLEAQGELRTANGDHINRSGGDYEIVETGVRLRYEGPDPP